MACDGLAITICASTDAVSGMLTGTGKVNRTALLEKYSAQLQEQYDAIESRKDRLLTMIKQLLDPTAGTTIVPVRVITALTRVVASKLKNASGFTFAEVGADSVLLLRLGSLVRQEFGCELPLDFLLKAKSFNDLASFLEGNFSLSLF